MEENGGARSFGEHHREGDAGGRVFLTQPKAVDHRDRRQGPSNLLAHSTGRIASGLVDDHLLGGKQKEVLLRVDEGTVSSRTTRAAANDPRHITHRNRDGREGSGAAIRRARGLLNGDLGLRLRLGLNVNDLRDGRCSTTDHQDGGQYDSGNTCNTKTHYVSFVKSVQSPVTPRHRTNVQVDEMY